MQRVLVLSPHTDDAELGCGGTIVKLIENGDSEICWIVFSTAEESLPDGMPKNTLKEEFLDVVDKLKMNPNNVIIKSYSVRKLHEKRQEILEELIQVRNNFKPDLIIGPSLHDFHQDHQVIANEMIRAFKTTASIICYELPWNNISFDCQLFVTLSEEQIQKKYDMLTCYQSQTIKGRKYFNRNYIFGLAATRGTQTNSEFAEAFEVVRWIL